MKITPPFSQCLSTLTSPLSFPLPKSHHFSHTHSSHLISHHLSLHYLSLSLTPSSLFSLSLTLTHSLISLSLSSLILSHSLLSLILTHSQSCQKVDSLQIINFFSLICVFGVSFEFVWGLGLSKGEELEFGLDLLYNNFRRDYPFFLIYCTLLIYVYILNIIYIFIG